MSDANEADDAEQGGNFSYDPMGQSLPAQVRDYVQDGNQVSESDLADLSKYEKMCVVASLAGVDTPDNSGQNANFSDGELGAIINGMADLYADAE